MNILIAGGGTIGALTAEMLSREGHAVTVIEPDANRIKRIQDRLDITVVQGTATDASALSTANVQKVELFLALSDDDEVNVIACSLAKSAGVARTVARLNRSEFIADSNIDAIHKLGVDKLVDMNKILREKIIDFVKNPGVVHLSYYANDSYAILKYSFNAESALKGKELSDLGLPASAHILGYEQVSDFTAGSDCTVDQFTYVYVACPASEVETTIRILSKGNAPVRKVIVYGSGYKSSTTGIELAEALQKLGCSVDLVEDDRSAAEFISSRTKMSVLCDDPSDPHFVRSGTLSGVDMFIGMSGNFERNLYSAAVAQRNGVPYSLATVRHPEHTSFVSSLPITQFLSPGLLAVNQLLSFTTNNVILRGILAFGKAECCEIAVTEKSKLIGAKIFSAPCAGATVLAILHQGTLHTNHASVVAGDHAIVLLTNGAQQQISSLL